MVVAVAAVTFTSSSAVADVDGARISVTPSTTVSVGDTVQVGLTGWPQGVVTAAVCGNNAQRGSTDCEQTGAGSIGVRESGSEVLTVDVLAPPVGCPCVIRASTTNGDVVRTAPIDIVGVPGGFNLAPAAGAPSADSLDVTAHVEAADVGWPESWYPAFAAPAHRDLVLTMSNRSDAVMSGLRVVGAVGPSKTDEAEPVSKALGPIPPHSTRTFRVPFTLSAPVWGDYVVSGSIYGLAAPVTFKVKTASEPWALELLLPLSLFVIAQILRRQERARRRAEEAALAEEAAAASSLPFPQSSPDVGASDGGHWVMPSYDQPHAVPAELDLRETTPATADSELVKGSS
jgi:hypothetical protein